MQVLALGGASDRDDASETGYFAEFFDPFRLATRIGQVLDDPGSTAAIGRAAREPSTQRSAMAKLFASETAMHATTEAVQIFGGYGYMRDYPVEKLMRDAKATEIYEGTNEIQRVVIARALYV